MKESNQMILIDAHADTLWRMAEEPGQAYDISLERLKEGGISLQVLAMYVGINPQPEAVAAQFVRLREAHQTLLRAGWHQLKDPAQAEEGKVAFMLSLEGCEPFGESLEAVFEYRQLGVRMAAITWNYENALGSPACMNQTKGLKPYGLRAVREMQRLGIATDVSHLSIAGFYDLLNKTDAPPLASHSCCRALCEHTRNLSDRQLKDLFHAGGYAGVNFYPSFLRAGSQPCDINTVIDHIDHMHQVGGAGMIGFGSDFDGISEKPQGLEHPGHFPGLIQGLRSRGYKEDDVMDIAGRSFIRYFNRISR
jgi:membrane dipeptidase